jgi:hypothetical protein
MLKRLVISAALLLASWSMATASHAGFSINLPGFALDLPLPGAGISIGLPVFPAPPAPSYHRVEMYETPVYVRPDRHSRYYEYEPACDRSYRRHETRGYHHGPDRFDNDGFRGYGRYR